MTPPFQREVSLLSVLLWHSYQVRPEPGGAVEGGRDCSTDLLEKVLSLIWGGGAGQGGSQVEASEASPPLSKVLIYTCGCYLSHHCQSFPPTGKCGQLGLPKGLTL